MNICLLLPEYNSSNRGFQGHYEQRQEKQDISKFRIYLVFLVIGLHMFPFSTYISHDSWDVPAYQTGNVRVFIH